MTFLGWLTIFAFAVILTALAMPLGRYMAAVLSETCDGTPFSWSGFRNRWPWSRWIA